MLELLEDPSDPMGKEIGDQFHWRPCNPLQGNLYSPPIESKFPHAATFLLLSDPLPCTSYRQTCLLFSCLQ